jgi:branched-chain amino acid transport system substrate-binding protein
MPKGAWAGAPSKSAQLDDGYEPDRCVANTKKLIDDDVFALFGYIGTPTSVAALPLATKARMPFFAPFTGAMALREPFSKTTFHVRASYNDETALIVKQLTNLGLKKIAVFYQNDAYGKAGLDGVTLALAAQKLPGGAGHGGAQLGRRGRRRATIKRGRRPTRWCRSAPTSPAPPLCAARKAGFGGTFYNVSFVGTQALADELGKDGAGVVVSQVVPSPYNPARQIAREFSTRPRRPATCSPTSPAWRVTWPPRCLPKACAAAASGKSPRQLIVGMEVHQRPGDFGALR